MLIYFFVLFIISPFVIIDGLQVKLKSKYLYVCFILFLLFLLSAIRYDVGVDYVNYEELFENSLYSINPKIKEIGFAFFLYSLNTMGFPYELFVVIFSVLSIYFVSKYILKYSPFIFLSIIIFYSFGQFYFNTFNAVRQTLAAYIFLNCLTLIERKKVKTYLFMCLITSIFVHASFILLFLLYFFLRRKYSIKIKCIFFLLIFITSNVFVNLMSISFYAIYLDFTNFFSEVSPTTYFLLIISIFFIVMDILMKNKSSIEILFYNINYFSFLLLSLIVFYDGTPVVMPLNRFSYYFTPIYIVLIPMAISRLKIWSNRFICICSVYLIFSLLFYLSLELNGISNKIVPYQTILYKYS